MNSYKTKGTCSREIKFELDENHIITYVEFVGGCRGNLIGIAKLIVGEKAEDVINKVQGVVCRGNTSCPDQLAIALSQHLATL